MGAKVRIRLLAVKCGSVSEVCDGVGAFERHLIIEHILKRVDSGERVVQ